LNVDENIGVIKMSALFDWYESDFLHWLINEKKQIEPQILDYIQIYYDGKFKKSWNAFRIEYNEYDWSLNDLP